MTSDSRADAGSAKARIQGHAAQAIGKTREDVALALGNVEQVMRAYETDDAPSPDTHFRAAWHLAETVGRVEMTAHTLINCYGVFTPSDWRARLEVLGDDAGSPLGDPLALMGNACARLTSADQLLSALYDELRELAVLELGTGAFSDAELARLTSKWESAPQ